MTTILLLMIFSQSVATIDFHGEFENDQFTDFGTFCRPTKFETVNDSIGMVFGGFILVTDTAFRIIPECNWVMVDNGDLTSDYGVHTLGRYYLHGVKDMNHDRWIVMMVDIWKLEKQQR